MALQSIPIPTKAGTVSWSAGGGVKARLALLARSLAVAVGLALLLVMATGAAQAADPVTVDVTAEPVTIAPGETTVYTVTLENASGAPLNAGVVLSMTLTGPYEKIRPSVNRDETGGVLTDSVNRNGGELRWEGRMGPNGKLVLNVTVKSFMVEISGVGALTLNAEAQVPGASPVVDDATVTVQPPEALDPNQVQFEKRLLDTDGNPLPVDDGASDWLTGEPLIMELRMTNNSAGPVVGLLVDEMGTATAQAAAVDAQTVCRLTPVEAKVLQGDATRVPNGALGNDAGLYAFLATTQPGESAVVQVTVRPVGGVDCRLQGQARAHLRALPAGTTEPVVPTLPIVRNLRQVQPSLSALVALLILASDFGDAPDSSNHFTPGAMTAYAPNIQGRFPTVFDPALGLPQGPKHKWVRPLFLGAQVSLELSPDLGPGRNLDPAGDMANLDVRDDGVDLSTLSFAHCVATSIDVELTASQYAVNQLAANETTAYLNIWLDGNRDGDWDDVLGCDDIQATEHIVIDQPIAPATAGTFTVVAPTRNIPIPQGEGSEPMWLRVTVSDTPSEKIGQVNSLGQLVDYGDGRGPVNGFRWGETEDYLYVPPGAASAPFADLDLTAQVQVELESLPGAVSGAALDASLSSRIRANLRLRNLGGAGASAPTLTIGSDPYLGIPTVGGAKCCRCLTCTLASALPAQITEDAVFNSSSLPFREVCDGEGNCRQELNLAGLPPGQEVELFLGWDMATAMENDVAITFSVAGQGQEGNDANNRVETLARRLVRPPVISFPPSGVIREPLTATLTFKGFAEPGSQLLIQSPGLPDDVETTADAQGFWQAGVDLPAGNHRVQVQYAAVPGLPPAAVNALDKSSPLLLAVDSTLPWSPGSFGWEMWLDKASPTLQAAALAEADDSCGPWSFVDEAGRMETDGWRIPVVGGRQLEIGVDLVCAAGDAAATLDYSGRATPLAFADSDGDGRHTATWLMPEIGDEVAVEFAVTCGGVETVYNGFMEPAGFSTVVDAATNLPLGDAEVVLWQLTRSEDGRRFQQWDAQAFGQTNPQTTGADGLFSFLVPQGRYGLSVARDGYQPFRAGPFRLAGPLADRTIALAPRPSGAEVRAVSITEEGFVPPVVTVEPGQIVQWTNVGLNAASSMQEAPAGSAATVNWDGFAEPAVVNWDSVAGDDPAVASSGVTNGVNWDSGALQNGERFLVQFDTPGEYLYVNGEDPTQQAIIRVEMPDEDAIGPLFLPLLSVE